MTLEELVRVKSQRVLELQAGKRLRADPERLRRLAAEIAEQERAIAEILLAGSEQDRATVNLVSQASCLVDAGRIAEAFSAYRRAAELTQRESLRRWIVEETTNLREQLRPEPDSITSENEYRLVERPFLDQLSSLGWTVVDQGLGVPSDPKMSHRTSFTEVALRGVFGAALRRINRLEDGREWLSDAQLDELFDDLYRKPGVSLVEANEQAQKLVFKAVTDMNPITGEQYPVVKLIDFEHPEANDFIAINQFRIDTPGRVRAHIRPDIVLFVNGLPLVVVECKDASTHVANPMHEAFEQLMRYSDQRPATRNAGLREGEPRLFYTNLLLVRTCGDRAEYGSVTSTDEEYFFPWREIHPERFRQYSPPLGKERAQEVLVQGMLAPATLLDILRTCTVFMETDAGHRVKVVCRYQQYRAVCKAVERLRSGKSPRDRSGVVWHTQGSGKSLTMVFIVRKLRACDDLKDYKVILVNDRNDLEDQLAVTATLTGEGVTIIDSTASLKTDLATPSSNLNMVMIHKFRGNDDALVPEYVRQALKGNEPVPEFKTLGVVNPSDRILIMVDEAHRTQSSDFGDALFEAFPSSTKIAFTGTPLITQRHTQKTWERFGRYLDKYRLQDAVDDGATVQILYEGKTAGTAVNEKSKFDEKVEQASREVVGSQLRQEDRLRAMQQEAEAKASGDSERAQKFFEDLFAERTNAELLAIKKKYGATGDILEAERRIEAIAADMVDHYVENILPNGFKAQVVCHSKVAAIRYKASIDKALTAWLAAERAKPAPDSDLIKRLAALKSAVVISSDGTNEKAVVTAARKHAAEVNAIDNFKKKFDFDDPAKANTCIAFLIVCDMLLTGFDAPVEQVMYIDKKIVEHNLLQAIARVNRVHRGKSRGYVVDYIGLAHHLREALAIYAGSEDDDDEEKKDKKDVAGAMRSIKDEVPVLEQRYRRLVQLFTDNGVKQIEPFVQQQIAHPIDSYEVLEQAVNLLKDVKLRADFEVYLKAMMQSMDIILPNPAANSFKVPVKRFGYVLAITKERYKDDSLDLSGAGEKIKALINEHLISLGIDPKIPPLELVSPNFVAELDKHISPKAKASEMEHAIRKHCKIHFEEDPALYTKLSEKLEALIQKHKEDWEQLVAELGSLGEEVEAGRKENTEGVTSREAPFYDLIVKLAFDQDAAPPEHAETVKALVREVIRVLTNTIGIVNFWANGHEVGKLKGRLSDLILFSGIDEIVARQDRLVTEVTSLAKSRHKDIVG